MSIVGCILKERIQILPLIAITSRFRRKLQKCHIYFCNTNNLIIRIPNVRAPSGYLSERVGRPGRARPYQVFSEEIGVARILGILVLEIYMVCRVKLCRMESLDREFKIGIPKKRL